MFKTSLLIAIRRMFRHISFSVISISGLALSLAVSLFLWLFVLGELSYDRFHQHAEDIYRINVVSYNPEGDFYRTRAPAPLANYLTTNSSVVRSATLVTRTASANDLMNANGRSFNEKGVFLSDDGFFDVFGFKLLEGSGQGMLNDPGEVVISESVARRFFGRQNAVGEILTYENQLELKVTGVMANPPARSTLQPHFLISNATPGVFYNDRFLSDWGNSTSAVYLKLTPDADPASVEQLFPNIVETYIKSSLDRKEWFEMGLQSLVDIHLNPHVPPEQAWAASNQKYVIMFPFLAFFLLLIAGFNFVNMSIAAASGRYHETGVRKVLGTGKVQLMGHFTVEGILYSAIALVVSFVLAALLLPGVNGLLATNFTLGDMLNPIFLGVMSLLAAILFVASGLYPALVLTRLDIVNAFSGGSGAANKRSFFRDGLMIVQFTVAILMTAGAVAVYQQMEYLRTRSLGFQPEQVIYFIETDAQFWNQSESFRTELEKQPGISSVSFSSGIPGRIGYSGTARFNEGEARLEMNHVMLDEQFMNTYGFRLKSGVELNEDTPAEFVEGYVLNETAVETMGFERPLDERITVWGREAAVVGVVEDFQFASMRDPIGPLALHFGQRRYHAVSIKLQRGDIEQHLGRVQSVWASMMPGRPFSYEFLDEHFAGFYEEERRFSKITGVVSIIGIALAISGLFGLTSLFMTRRAKEISIRRVFGAGLGHVLGIFLNRALVLVALASIAAVPLASSAIEVWLGSFAYHIDVSWTIYAMSAGLLTLVMSATIVTQVTKSAVGKPAEVLRNN